jgi:hypothetical protein
MGTIETEGRSPINYDREVYGWYYNVSWGGWFPTMAEAVDDAPAEAVIVRKRISQSCVGTKSQSCVKRGLQ